jgi:putative transposase
MSASAKGTIDSPGRKVAQKSGLNREILDAGWGEFRRQLEYKLQWANGTTLAIDPKNTSRKCSVCGHTAKENRKTQADFVCVLCGHTDDADVNAAKNILRAGHALLACQANDLKISSAAGTGISGL